MLDPQLRRARRGKRSNNELLITRRQPHVLFTRFNQVPSVVLISRLKQQANKRVFMHARAGTSKDARV